MEELLPHNIFLTPKRHWTLFRSCSVLKAFTLLSGDDSIGEYKKRWAQFVSKAVTGRWMNTSDTSQSPQVHRMWLPPLETSRPSPAQSVPATGSNRGRSLYCHLVAHRKLFCSTQSRTPKHQTHMIFTPVSKMTLLWISGQPPVLVTCTLPQLNLLSHKKGMEGGRDMPVDLCQQKLNLWPHPITNITLPFPSPWLTMNTVLLSPVPQQNWLSLSEERKPIRN